MSKPLDATEQRILQNLQSLIGGLNPVGGKVGPAEQRAAEQQYLALKQRDASEDAWHRKQAAEEKGQQHQQGLLDRQHNLESTKAEASDAVEHRKLDLEAERIEVAKAEVVLRALEIAARNPDIKQLGNVVQELSFRLLGGEVLPAIEDKSTKK